MESQAKMNNPAGTVNPAQENRARQGNLPKQMMQTEKF